MANPLIFVTPLRYDARGTILVVETGSLARLLAVADRIHALFPEARVEALVRPSDAAVPALARLDGHVVRRFDERVALVRRLRARRFDAVAVPLGGSPALWLLPLLLRTGAVLVFNDGLDYVPLTLGRLPALVRHLCVAPASAAGARRLARATLVQPVALVVLLAATARIEWHRRRRARTRGRDVVAA